ncbi:MAG: sodium/solute symporter [Rhizobiales bacterium]|nr:sodium/solute symporter [Hyphomicrobiales bacterium]
MPTFHLQPLDLAIIVAYFAIVLVIGYAVSRRLKSGDDLFLAGRSLGFAAIGFSLFASNVSSTTLIGLSGQAYSTGISVANYEWMAGLLFLFMAFTTIPVFLKSQITTVPEYLERRFSPVTRKYFSALTIFLSIFVDTAASIYAGVLVLQTFVPELPFVPTCFALAILAGAYTTAGGLKAVVYTDILQAVVLLIGSTAIAYSVFAEFNFSWDQAVASLPEGRLSLIRPMDDPTLPWLGTLIGVPILGFYYWSTNQYIVQRVLGARNVEEARWGAALAGLLKITPLFIMVLPGVFAATLLPGLPDGDMVFPNLIKTYLPVGFTGLALAGLIAAIMSTVDSTLNSASTLVLHDFMDVRGQGWDDARILRVGRLVTGLLIIIAAIWPLAIREFPGLFNYIQQVFSYAVPPVVAIFLLGMFWRRTGASAALATLIFGHVLGAGIFAWRAYHASQGIPDGLPHFTIVAGIVTFICMGFCAVLSLAVPAKAPAEDTMWIASDAAPHKTLGWFQDYRIYSGVVAILTIAMVIIFW